MATTDINGLVYYETTDPVTPLQNVLNAMTTSVTNALDATDRIFYVADQTARDNLLAARGAPLTVAREDTDMWERNTGSGWVVVTPRRPASGQVRAVTLSASGTVPITHGLGVVPTAVVCTAAGFGGTDDFTFRTESRNAATANVVVYRNGAIAASYTFASGYGFDWLAIA